MEGMMQCSVFIATSLDGYIARPDGGLDWLRRVEREGEDYGYKQFADTVDVLVTGRGTYDVVRDFETWPYPGKRVIVLTHRPAESLYGEEFHAGPIAELVRRLVGEGVHRVYVDGGVVIQQFLAAGLIDDLTISIIPVVLGDGIRLFGGGQPERGLVLDGTETFPSGLVQLRYRTER
jgi:dihydrofolate reductase